MPHPPVASPPPHGTRLVVLSECAAEDLIWLRQLRQSHAFTLVHLTGHAPGRTKGWAKRRYDRIQRRISLGAFGVPRPPTPTEAGLDPIEIPASRIHDADTIEQLRALAPDYLLVSGAPLLDRRVTTLPTLVAVNLHWGIAPDYRGGHAPFWAMYEGRWDCIGVTLHQIDDGIDTGKLYAQGRPAIEPGDREPEFWIKNAAIAAMLVSDFLDAGPPAVTQGHRPNRKGRNYPYRARSGWKDWVMAARLRLGTAPPALPERVRRFYDR